MLPTAKSAHAIDWLDVRVGDFDGDGRDDIAGRANGNWWLARSSGNAFQNQYWGRWSSAVAWSDVLVGDFDGDGRDDIAGRAIGQWWMNRSLGNVFAVEYWGRWSNGANWLDVQVGDFDGDGQDDIAGRANGNWWVSRSNSNFFSIEHWGSWSTSQQNWRSIRIGSFDAAALSSTAHGFSNQSIFNTKDNEVLAKDLIFANSVVRPKTRGGVTFS